jgi:hypothetical protein
VNNDDDAPVNYGALGSLIIHERVREEDEEREVHNEPIGFVHFAEVA